MLNITVHSIRKDVNPVTTLHEMKMKIVARDPSWEKVIELTLLMLIWLPQIQRGARFWQQSEFQGNAGGAFNLMSRMGKSSVLRLLMSAIVEEKFPNGLTSD